MTVVGGGGGGGGGNSEGAVRPCEGERREDGAALESFVLAEFYS